MFAKTLRGLVDGNIKTQKEIAAETGVSTQALSDYCNGLRQPGLCTAGRLAEFFNVTLDYLVGHDETQIYGMNFATYQTEAQRTSSTRKAMDKLTNGALGLCGEAGEVSEPLKKHLFQGHDLDREKMIDELGDVLWYCAEIATGLQISLDLVAERNIQKLKHRYPDGFDAERSAQREDAE